MAEIIFIVLTDDILCSCNVSVSINEHAFALKLAMNYSTASGVETFTLQTNP